MISLEKEIESQDATVLASLIGDSLLSQATRDASGLWWGRGFDRKRERTRDAGLFNGPVGEALFLAALWKATRNDTYRSAALDAGAHSAFTLESGGGERLHTSLGVGGVAGLASLAYGHWQLGTLLSSERHHDAALTAAAWLRPSPDSTLVSEVFWGEAGAALALLALHDEGAEGLLSLATKHARRIADAVLTSAPKRIESSSQISTTGFAHGSSGIAGVLVAVGRRAGSHTCVEAGLSLFARDREAYQPEVNDWLDDPSRTGDRPWGAWCRGAAGIALSRLVALRGPSALDFRPADRAMIELDIKRALVRTVSVGLAPPHSLCCGSLGRADILLTAANALNNPALAVRANQLVARVHRDAEAEHARPLQEPQHIRGGLWQGVTGLGYVLLRIAAPSGLPSVLSLAPARHA